MAEDLLACFCVNFSMLTSLYDRCCVCVCVGVHVCGCACVCVCVFLVPARVEQEHREDERHVQQLQGRRLGGNL